MLVLPVPQLQRRIKVSHPFPTPDASLHRLAKENGTTDVHLTQVNTQGAYNSILVGFRGNRSVEILFPTDLRVKPHQDIPPLFYGVFEDGKGELLDWSCISERKGQLKYLDSLIDFLESPDLKTPKPLWPTTVVTGILSFLLLTPFLYFMMPSLGVNDSPRCSLSLFFGFLGSALMATVSETIRSDSWDKVYGQSHEETLKELTDLRQFIKIQPLMRR